MVQELINQYTEGTEPYADRMSAQYKSALPIDEITYTTLHKDIKLEPTPDKKFDRVVQSGDFVVVTGRDALAAAIRIKLQTWWGELNELPTYRDFGNKAWFHLKGNKTELTKMELKGHVEEALNEMRRIQTLNSIDLIDYGGELNEPGILAIDPVVTPINDKAPFKIQQEVLNYGI